MAKIKFEAAQPEQIFLDQLMQTTTKKKKKKSQSVSVIDGNSGCFVLTTRVGGIFMDHVWMSNQKHDAHLTTVFALIQTLRKMNLLTG